MQRERGRRARQRQVRLPSHFATPAPTRRRHLRLKPQESATHERRLREQGNGKQEAAGRSVAAQKKKEEHERRVRSKATNTKGEHETRRKDRGRKGRGREGIGGKGQEGERKGKAGEKQQLRQRRTTGPQTWVALRRVHELGAVVVGDGGLDGAHRGGVVGNGTVSGEGTANHGSDAERLPQVAEHHRALPVAAQHRDGGRHSHGRQPCRTPDPQ